MHAIDTFDGLPTLTDLSHPANRSMLYSIVPIGLGSPLQESLLSFLVRVSRAHAINPRRLIGEVLTQIDPAISNLAYAGFFRKLAKTVNGIGQYAEQFATVLERATGVKNLDKLTMLPWRDLFPFNGQGMLAEHPQWCPNCLMEQWREFGERYLPLVWALASYRVCTIHNRKLETACPHCKKNQSFVPRYPDAGVCSECGGFLVAEEVLGRESAVLPNESEYWAANALQEMVARQASSLVLPKVEDFRVFVTEMVKKETDGNRAAFCKRFGLKDRALNGWLFRGKRPSMMQFLNFCCRLDISPASLAKESVTFIKRDAAHFSEQLFERRRCPRLTPAQRRKIRIKLELELSASVYQPVSCIASMLGVSARSLRYWFPQQCAALTERARAVRGENSRTHQAGQASRVKEIVRQVRLANHYPSRRQVNTVLRKEGMALAQPHLLMAYREAVLS